MDKYFLYKKVCFPITNTSIFEGKEKWAMVKDNIIVPITAESKTKLVPYEIDNEVLLEKSKYQFLEKDSKAMYNQSQMLKNYHLSNAEYLGEIDVPSLSDIFLKKLRRKFKEGYIGKNKKDEKYYLIIGSSPKVKCCISLEFYKPQKVIVANYDIHTFNEIDLEITYDKIKMEEIETIRKEILNDCKSNILIKLV
jgi:hypothetical protein